MKNKFKNALFTLITLALVAVPVLALSSSANALSYGVEINSTYGSEPNISDSTCGGTTLQAEDGGGPDCSTVTQGAGEKFNTILTNIVNIFSIVVGIIAVIMIIVGGFRYITSGGATESVSSAKSTIIYALVGLIIVALAQFIVHFVIGKVAGIGG